VDGVLHVSPVYFPHPSASPTSPSLSAHRCVDGVLRIHFTCEDLVQDHAQMQPEGGELHVPLAVFKVPAPLARPVTHPTHRAHIRCLYNNC